MATSFTLAKTSLHSGNKLPHWSDAYIGKPWVKKARGPDAFDCWGLLWYVYLKQRNIKLPLFSEIDIGNAREVAATIRSEIAPGFGVSQWVELPKPEEFCAVSLAVKDWSHVGIYTENDGGFVIHALEGGFVQADRLERLLKTRFRKAAFFHHALRNTNL